MSNEAQENFKRLLAMAHEKTEAERGNYDHALLWAAQYIVKLERLVLAEEKKHDQD